jgi:hypothetical protein
VTEEEWRQGVSFAEALREPQVRLSERKRRLFVCACVRRTWPLLADQSRRAVAIGEQFADGLVADRERELAWMRCLELRFLGVGTPADRAALVACGEGAKLSSEEVIRACAQVSDALLNDASCKAACGLMTGDDYLELSGSVRGDQEARFHDVVGDPFRLWSFVPDLLAWDGGLLPHLARQIYDGRRWGELTVLGDALEDAGCSDEEVLWHCHGPGPHVRGCWVVDRLLGME